MRTNGCSAVLIALAMAAMSAAALAKPPCLIVCNYQKGTPAPAPPADTGGINPVPTEAVPRAFAYDLTVARVGSGDITEFTPMTITWKLSVSEFGVVGPHPAPIDLDICPTIWSPNPPTVCSHINRARAGRTYSGTMSVSAPPAGKQSPLTIVAARDPQGEGEHFQKVPVAEASIPVDVGATYDLAVTGFEVVTTRSTSTDTIWTTAKGMVKATPQDASETDAACGLAGFSWCLTDQKFGDVDGGKHALSVRVGPYFLVPEREQDLRLLFWLDNHSDSVAQEVGLAVANAFSKVGMIALSAYGAGSGNAGAGGVAAQLDSVMEAFHSSAFASCDGVVATDIAVISNVTVENQPQLTLDAFTRSTGEHVVDIPQIYHNTDGDFRCDRRGGNYRVSYTVYRTSWRDWGFRSAF
jgi:hypothetical protein